MRYAYQDSTFIRDGDGLSTTMMLSESTGSDNLWHASDYEWRAGMVFFPPVSQTLQAPKPDVHPINAPGTSPLRFDTARPSSNHLGGVNAIFCDGHARFLRQDMEYRVYCALMTAKGGHALDPGTPTPSPTVRQQPKLTGESF